MSDLQLLTRRQTSKRSRLPRWRRASNPPPMEVTERDLAILRTVYAFRLITREQVERLLFPPTNGRDNYTRTSITRHRLKLLFHNGYVERLPVPVKQGAWAWRPLYRLAKKGAQLIAEKQGITLSELPYWGRRFDKDQRRTVASELFVDHLLKINDVRIALILAADAPGCRIEQWIDDAALKSQERQDFVATHRHGGKALEARVIPDGYFVLNLGNRRAHFFLELDQATMSNQRWKSKVLAYQQYVASGSYHEKYQTQSLRILTVTTTEKRLKNLKKVTERVGGGRMFWFSTFGRASTEQVLSGHIWLVAGETTPRPLV
jgi:hypothetical protein